MTDSRAISEMEKAQVSRTEHPGAEQLNNSLLNCERGKQEARRAAEGG